MKAYINSSMPTLSKTRQCGSFKYVLIIFIFLLFLLYLPPSPPNTIMSCSLSKYTRIWIPHQESTYESLKFNPWEFKWKLRVTNRIFAWNFGVHFTTLKCYRCSDTTDSFSASSINSQKKLQSIMEKHY